MHCYKITVLKALINPNIWCKTYDSHLQSTFQSRAFRESARPSNGIRTPWRPCLCIDEEQRDRLVWCTKHPTNCRSLWGRSMARSLRILVSSVPLLSSARLRDCWSFLEQRSRHTFPRSRRRWRRVERWSDCRRCVWHLYADRALSTERQGWKMELRPSC